MLLYSSQQSKGFTSIIKLLNDMEKDWVNEQKKFQQLKITEKIQSINTQNACSSVNNGMDLQLVLKNSKQLWTWIQIREKIVRTELFFYWDTNKKTDVVQQPDLFKINEISHDKQLLNLCVLLAEHDLANDFVLLLSNKDAATKLLSQNSVDPTKAHNEEALIKVGWYYITLMTEKKMNKWYIASCEGKNLDGTYEIDDLTRVQRGSNLKWKQPARINKINSQAESIVECGVNGEWDVSQERNMTFTLQNHVYISILVKTMFTWQFELFLHYDTILTLFLLQFSYFEWCLTAT